MAPLIVIPGGGTGRTLAANRLRHAIDDAEITVVDQDDRHVYQPGLLFVPFGEQRLDEITRPRATQLHHGISYRNGDIDHVDLDANRVFLAGSNELPYDVLDIATGAVLVPEETRGLADSLARSSLRSTHQTARARCTRHLRHSTAGASS